jgi:predicted ATP-dependent endonuclease of OLD family
MLMVMEFKLINLGTIRETTLNLRPLTVLIGQNNSHKTYIAYTVYGIYKALRCKVLLSEIANMFSAQDWPATSLDNCNQFAIDFNPLVEATHQNLKVLLVQFNQLLSKFFHDSSNKLFAKTRIELDLDQLSIAKEIAQIINQVQTSAGQETLAKYFPESDCYWQDNQLIITFPPHLAPPAVVSNGCQSQAELRRQRVQGILGYIQSTIQHQQVYSTLFLTPFLLPAERNVFVTIYKQLYHTRYKALQRTLNHHQTSSYNVPDFNRTLEDLAAQYTFYPEPVEDFFDFLTDLELYDNTLPRSAPAFQNLAAQIEQYIQNGSKTELRKMAAHNLAIKVQVKRGLAIDLHNASSSIKQLAALILYLRYRAHQGDLLIIDEPEMNLHPEGQAKLLEILAALVNNGVYVLLTTHSPYFMNHLNNLVIANRQNPLILKKQSKKLYTKNPQAFLNKEDVGAYAMQNNQIISLADADYGFRWDTLSDVSQVLHQKYFEIATQDPNR